MPPGAVSTLRSASHKDGAGDPAMPLVVDGVCFFQIREAAVLRLESGLQVGSVVDRMRIRIAGEQFETFGEALLYVEGERVIPRTGIGKLRVHAVERNRRAEAGWVTRQLCQTHQRSIAVRH